MISYLGETLIMSNGLPAMLLDPSLILGDKEGDRNHLSTSWEGQRGRGWKGTCFIDLVRIKRRRRLFLLSL